MKIATWNVNGIRARGADVQAWVEQARPDVLCLQEIKAMASQIPPLMLEADGYWSYWHGGPKGYSGVSIHVRKEFSPECPVFLHPEFDHETRIVVAQCLGLRVASIYVPNGGKDYAAKLRFMEALALYAAASQAEDADFVLCGDLNIARTDRDVHPTERKPVTGQLPEERKILERVIGAGLLDVGRAMAPDDDGLFTWWAPWRNMKAKNIGWRLDYVLASERLAAKAVSCKVEREVGTSDHAPVVAVFG